MSQVDEEIEKIQVEVDNLHTCQEFLERHRTTLEQSGLKWFFGLSSAMLFIMDMSHKQMTDVRRALNVPALKKTPNSDATNPALDYQGLSDDGVVVLFYHAGLAPNCRVVYEDVPVPACEAHTEKRMHIVCGKDASGYEVALHAAEDE